MRVLHPRVTTLTATSSTGGAPSTRPRSHEGCPSGREYPFAANDDLGTVGDGTSHPADPAGEPNPGKPEETPAAVADTDVAVTDPSLAFEPCTTTVSPT